MITMTQTLVQPTALPETTTVYHHDRADTPQRPRRGLLVRRLPFTVTVTALMLIVGLVTGALWDAAADRSWFPRIAYGLPAFLDGAWWTPVTGPFFALEPGIYLPMVGSFVLLAGYTEFKLGTRITAVTVIGGQLIGVLGAAAVLLPLQFTNWAWAQELSGHLDLGFSAGALAGLAVVSGTLRDPWRLRVRLALLAYVAISFVLIGALADLEHLIAVVAALILAPLLIDITPAQRPSRREWRLLAATGLALTAVVEVVASVIPADGPVGSTSLLSDSPVGVAVTVVVVALVVNSLRHGRRLAWWTAVVLAVVNVFAAGQFVIGDEQSEFAGLIVAMGVLWLVELSALLTGRRAFAVPARRRTAVGNLCGAADPAFTKGLLHRYGGGSLSWMATWPENRTFVRPDGRNLLAYQRHAGVVLGLGDPIGPAEQHAATIREFAAMADLTGATPVLFSVDTRTREVTTAMGWRSAVVAQDTLIDLPDLEFRGKRWQDVRSALNRAARDDIHFQLVTLAEQDPTVITQIRHMSQDWVADKVLPEMGFTLGGVDEALDPEVRVALAIDNSGHIHGMTSWLPVYGPGGRIRGWTLDLMRRRADAFRPVVEFLIASSSLAFKSEGAEFVSLSGAPLAHADTDLVEGVPRESAAVDRLLDVLGANLEPVYGFRSLHAFKTKFSPRYEPMYLAYRDEADLPRIGIAITRAYLPGVRASELVRLVARH